MPSRFSFAAPTTLAAVAFLASTLANAGAANAAGSARPCGVYAGTIGTHAVVAEFCIDVPTRGGSPLRGTIGGQYYYRNVGTSIALDGAPAADGSLRFDELVESEKTFSLVPSGDRWNVRASGDNVEGSWCHACAKPGAKTAMLAVKLGKIAALAADPIVDETDVYHTESLRYPLTRSSEHAAGAGIGYVTVSDDRYGAKSIELSRFPGERARAAANALLASRLRQDRIDAFECLSDARGGASGSGQWMQTVHVALLNARVLSLDERVSYECGGPYPTSDESAPVTIDMRTGTAITWSKVFEPGAEASLAGRFGKGGAGDDCDYKIALSEGYGRQYWFTATGLAMRPEFPHVAAVCNVIVIVPYADVAPLFKSAYRSLL